MKDQNEVSQPAEALSCPTCGGANVSTRIERLEFDYGRAPDQVRLAAKVPVHTCTECAFSFTGEGAEVATHEAVCHYLGVMTPREIRDLREKLAMTRADFSELTHFGEASLARWERGALVQNSANDQLLYLLQFDDNVRRLRKRNSLKPTEGRVLRFRSLKNPERMREQAGRFKLCC